METTVIRTMELDLEDLRAGITIRYGSGEAAFTIPGSEVENFVLQQIVKTKQKKIAASLN